MSMLREKWTYKKQLPASVLTYLTDLRSKLDLSMGVMAKLDEKVKESSKSLYDRNMRDDPLEVGDEVLVLHPDGPRT